MQAYMSTVPSRACTIVPWLQQCITDVADWCGSRRLQLNAAETELMWFGSSASLNNLSQSDLTINDGTDVIQPVTTVRDLCVHLDSELTMRMHISKTSQTCFFHLRRLRQFRRLLSRDVTSVSRPDLQVPRTRLMFGERAFSSCSKSVEQHTSTHLYCREHRHF